MLEFLVGGCGGNEEAVAVPDAEAADDSGTCDGGVDYWDHALQFCLEYAV